MSIRLDLLLVKKGLVQSRQQAKELILQGQVFLEGGQVLKPGLAVAEDANLEIKGEIHPYPSRAGLKLERALDVFQINVEQLVALDVGASTGGFTSCLLQRGARKVFAVDVGRDQLHPDLKKDSRVINLEKTNVRELKFEHLGELVDLITIDVSFISLRLVIPAVRCFLKAGGMIVALVKPQFETGGAGLNKQGIITDRRIHLQFLPPLMQDLQLQGLALAGFELSPIQGAKGNREYLAYFRTDLPEQKEAELVENVIKSTWQD